MCNKQNYQFEKEKLYNVCIHLSILNVMSRIIYLKKKKEFNVCIHLLILNVTSKIIHLK